MQHSASPRERRDEAACRDNAVGPNNGLDHASAASIDNVVTIPATLLGRTLGFLSGEQEALLARAIVLAYDLEVPLLNDH